jgi:hypothetical protein
MKGLRTTIRCAAATLVLGAALVPGTAAAQGEDAASTRVNNSWWIGLVQVRNDNGKMLAYASASPGRNGLAAVLKIRLQRRGCGSNNWKTKAFNPSKGGFSKPGEADKTRKISRGGRGWWRATAVFAHKPRRGAPVDRKKTYRSPAWGECRPVPPPP